MCSSSRFFVGLLSLVLRLARDPNAESTQNLFVTTDGSVSQTNALVSLYIEQPVSLNDIS